jgi:hypothetical protein
VKIKHLDATFRGSEHGVIFVAARHLALQAACAFIGVDMQCLLHQNPLVKYFWNCTLRASQSNVRTRT